MPQTLLSAGEILSHTWSSYQKYWNRLFPMGAWMILPPAVLLVLSLVLPKMSPSSASFFFLAFVLAWLPIAFWIPVRVLRAILALEQGKELEPDESHRAWSYVLTVLWVNILTGLAVLGGSILLVLPGVWLQILFIFSVIVVVEEGLRGTKAMAASAALVRGRWWATFWQILVPMVVIGIVYFLISAIVGFLIGTSLGTITLTEPAQKQAVETSLVSFAIGPFVGSILTSIFLPLFLLPTVILYRSLKSTAR